MTAEAASAYLGLAEEFGRRHPAEVARTLESEVAEAAIDFLGRATPAAASRVFERITPATAAALVSRMPPAEAARFLGTLDASRSAALLASLDDEEADARLAELPAALAGEIRELMIYPPETAGGLMHARVATFRPEATAGHVLGRLREWPAGRIADVVLVDADAHVLGTMAVEELALAAPETPIGDLDRQPATTVGAMAPRDEVVELMTRSRVRTVPVVDPAGRLLGVLRQDTLVRAVEEELSADVQTMVGVSKEEQALSPVSFAVRKRLPWLQINLVTAFLAASVVGVFEETIAQVTALAVLLPVVAGQSGNTGAQALAVTIRGLALREIRLRHWRVVSLKEGVVGLINGVGVALTTALGVYLWSRSAGLATVIGTSMVISMFVAGLAGALVPLGLVAVKQDPAQSSSIILTTVTDIVGFFSFLGIATLLMSSLQGLSG